MSDADRNGRHEQPTLCAPRGTSCGPDDCAAGKMRAMVGSRADGGAAGRGGATYIYNQPLIEEDGMVVRPRQE
jgi:hypothetical protein